MSVSKEFFDQCFKGVDCQTIIHPYHSSCYKSFIYHIFEGIKGTGKFQAMFYLLQLIARSKHNNKSITRDEILDFITCFIFSTLTGGAYCSLASGTMCLARNLVGKYNYYLLSGLGGFIGGLSIFIEHPKRRGYPIVTFLYLSIEFLFRRLEKSNYFKRTKLFDTIMFMMASSALFYLLRIVKHQATYLWLFTPAKYSKTNSIENNKICPHTGSCQRDIFMSGIKYFSFGVVLQWVRSLIAKLHLFTKQPLKVLQIELIHIKMGLFVGLYVTIYKSINCLLCQLQGVDSPLHAIPSGMVAGLTYLLKPDFSVTSIAISNVFIVALQYLKEKKKIPQWPFTELIFAICGAFLFHSRVFHPSIIQSNVIKFLSAYTNGRTDGMYRRIEAILYKSSMG